MATLIPPRFAVMAIDPGGTTGVAWGLFEACSSLRETLGTGRVESREVAGSSLRQALELSDLWQEKFAEWNLLGIPTPDIRLVIEGFQLRTQHADLSPVRVTEAFAVVSVLMASASWPGLEVQDPSEKGMATNERLRGWGLWVVGSEHRRDAVRHVAVCVQKVLGG